MPAFLAFALSTSSQASRVGLVHEFRFFVFFFCSVFFCFIPFRTIDLTTERGGFWCAVGGENSNRRTTVAPDFKKQVIAIGGGKKYGVCMWIWGEPTLLELHPVEIIYASCYHIFKVN